MTWKNVKEKQKFKIIKYQRSEVLTALCDKHKPTNDYQQILLLFDRLTV